MDSGGKGDERHRYGKVDGVKEAMVDKGFYVGRASERALNTLFEKKAITYEIV